MSEINDSTLYAEFLTGDNAAYDRLMLRYGDALTMYLKGFLYSWEDAEDLMIEAFATQDQNEQRERSGVMQDQNEQRERLIVTDRSFFKFFSILVRNFVMKRTLYV